VKLESISQLGLSFFGLTSETATTVRINLFTQIHEICFHGKGGYDWPTVYAMPRWLRQFTFNQINDFYQKEKEAQEKGAKGKNTTNVMDPTGKINTTALKDLPKFTPKTPSKPKTKYQ